MPNFGSNFLKNFSANFQPNYSNAFSRLSREQQSRDYRNYLDKVRIREAEQKRQEALRKALLEEQERQKNINIIDAIQRGTKNIGGGIFRGAMPKTEVPMTDEDKRTLAFQLSPEGWAQYKNMDKLIPDPVKSTKTSVIDIEDIEGGDKLKKDGYFSALVEDTYIDGELTDRNVRRTYKKTTTRTNGNGKKYKDATIDYAKHLNSAEKELQGALAIQDAIRNGYNMQTQEIHSGDIFDPITAAENVKVAQDQILSLIRRHGSPETNTKAKEYLDGLDESDPNFIPTLYSQIAEDYANGEFDDDLTVYRELKSWFFAKTGYGYGRFALGR